MLDFVFLEYSFDPVTLDPEVVFSGLSKLGFILRSEHVDQRASFWNQNQSIMLVHERPGSGISPGITGLGFMGLNNKMIDQLDAQHDPETGTFNYDSGSGYQTLIIPAEVTTNLGGIIKYSMVSRKFEESYKVIDTEKYSSPGLSHVSGIVLDQCASEALKHYTQLGFRATKESENYCQWLSTSDRFSLFIDKQNRTRARTLVVFDTDDVFWTTACYTANGLTMCDFHINNRRDFGSLTHKIVGYNCLAEGTRSSYNISKLMPEALPGVDLVFRMRKQFLGIPEQILEYASAK